MKPRKTSPANHTPVPEQPPQPPTPSLEDEIGIKLGQVIYIVTHTAEVEGIQFPDGGLVGGVQFLRKNPSTGEVYVTIYSNGYRTFNVKYARDPKKRSVPIGSSALAAVQTSGTTLEKKGDIVIECIGLPGKACDQTRKIHASDKHLVKRCKDCQKEFVKITTRERMRLKRAERKAAKHEHIPKKEMGGSGGTTRATSSDKRKGK